MIKQKEIPKIGISFCLRGSFHFNSRRQFAFLLRFFILAYTVGGEERAGHIVPDGEDRTGNAAGRSEVHESQRGSQTGILHADLDGHCAGLRLIETEAAGADMAEQHAAEVMQDDDSEDHKAVVEDGAAGEGDHAADRDDDDQR